MKISVIGSNPLYQWEKDRRISLEGADLTHRALFARPDGGAHVVDTFMEDGTVYAKIPNIWLQMSGIMRVYVVDGNEHVVHRASLFVTPREKPDSYVYTETEILSFVSLDERLRRLEGDPSVGGYATEQYVKDYAQPKGDYLESSALPAAIDTALAQAKESGAFDGAPGKDGQDGKDYVLTDDDRAEIAEQAAGLVEIPEGDGKAFIVTITESGDKYTADKIPSEIYAAHNSGVPVLASLMTESRIVIAYLVVATEYAAVFQAPNFMLGEEQMGVTVTIAGNEPEDRSVSIVETTIPDSGGNVSYDEAQTLTDEQKAQALENIGAQPAGNYLTEVPDDYAKTEDVPTDEEIIQLIKDNAPEPVGGNDLGITDATVGQTVKISAVDENGVPTAWEPVDFPREEIADVQLATGTIANGTEAGTVIDTGISVKMLRNYKKFKIRVTGASNVGLENCYFRFTNSSGYVNIARVGSSGFLGYFTWFDQDKTLLTSENWEGNTSLSNLYPNLIIGNKTSIHSTTYYNTCKPHVFYDTSMLADDDTLKIVLSAATTIDYTWEIRGVTV